MMQTRMSTETMATATGLDTSRTTPQTCDEILREQQACKDGYMQSSLKLKQIEIDAEIEKIDSAKCKVVEFKREILQHVDDAEKILSGAQSKIELSKCLDSDDKQQIKDALAVKRD